jgi:hypothetical protein
MVDTIAFWIIIVGFSVFNIGFFFLNLYLFQDVIKKRR